jgi:hypothetical protein
MILPASAARCWLFHANIHDATMRIILIILGFFILCNFCKAEITPNFNDYAVSQEQVGTAKLNIRSKMDRRYKTMLETAIDRQPTPNFAGHYIFASWGCGASCIQSVAINAKSGNVIWLPFTVCCFAKGIMDPIEYQLTSNLIIIQGSRNERGNGTYYYKLLNEKFILVKEHTPLNLNGD